MIGRPCGPLTNAAKARAAASCVRPLDHRQRLVERRVQLLRDQRPAARRPFRGMPRTLSDSATMATSTLPVSAYCSVCCTFSPRHELRLHRLPDAGRLHRLARRPGRRARGRGWRWRCAVISGRVRSSSSRDLQRAVGARPERDAAAAVHLLRVGQDQPFLLQIVDVALSWRPQTRRPARPARSAGLSWPVEPKLKTTLLPVSASNCLPISLKA